jgi:hypothetical protein
MQGYPITKFSTSKINKQKWKLNQDFIWRFRDGSSLKIPQGFISDKHSIPKFLQWLIAPYKYPEAAFVHDFLYKNKGKVEIYKKTMKQVKLSRFKSDLLYLEILKDTGSSFFRRYFLFGGTFRYGWVAWFKDK